MTLIKNIAIGFLGFLLLCSLTSLGMFFAIQNSLLNEQTYKDIVNDIDFESEIQPLMAEQISSQVPSQFSSYISQDFVNQLATEALPTAWFKSQLNLLIDNFFGYINNETTDFQLSLSFAEPKATIREKILDKITPLVAASPMPINVSAILDSYLVQMPDSINLKEQLPSDALSTLEQAKSILATLKIALILISIILIILIIIVSRELKGILRSIGGALAIAGASLVVSAIVLVNLLPTIMNNIGMQSNVLSPLILDVLQKIFASLSAQLNLFGLPMLIIGIILFAFTFVLPLILNKSNQKDTSSDVKKKNKK